MERTNAPEKFADHFDELVAPDLSMQAQAVCLTMVERELVAPGSAKFTSMSLIPRGRHRYLASAQLDAQNAFGEMLRGHYVCEIQYEGSGDPFVLANWTTHQLVVE